MKVMIKELDRAYGDSALEAGIYRGIEEFCKRFDVDDELKKKAGVPENDRGYQLHENNR